MAKTGTFYMITARGKKELADPTSWARGKFSLTLVEALLTGKALEREALIVKLAKSCATPTARVKSRLSAWASWGSTAKVITTVKRNVKQKPKRALRTRTRAKKQEPTKPIAAAA
jgi:hypothetical protein